MSAAWLCFLVVGQAPKVPEHKVDQAVDRGVAFLKAQLGRPMETQHPLQGRFPMDELVLYTLIHGGVDARDPAVARLAERAGAREIDRTYTAALAAMALEAVDAATWQSRIAQCGQYLVDTQAANGQWGYGRRIPGAPATASGGGAPKPGTKSLPLVRLKKRPGHAAEWGDNSNSQYAALGLRACAKAGVVVPDETLAAAAKWWEGGQRPDGSWGYNDEGMTGDAGYGAMTAGGVASLLIVREIQKQDGRKGAAAQKGLEWLGANLAWDRNPAYHHAWMWQYYWIYAVERAGDLAGTERLGSRWWYAEGCEHLFAAQKADGSWVGLSPEGKESVGGAVADTCFAILFLRRATRARPKVATGK